MRLDLEQLHMKFKNISAYAAYLYKRDTGVN